MGLTQEIPRRLRLLGRGVQLAGFKIRWRTSGLAESGSRFTIAPTGTARANYKAAYRKFWTNLRGTSQPTSRVGGRRSGVDGTPRAFLRLRQCSGGTWEVSGGLSKSEIY